MYKKATPSSLVEKARQSEGTKGEKKSIFEGATVEKCSK